MSQHDKDIQSSIAWLVGAAVEGVRGCLKLQNHADWCMGKAEMLTACSQLPGDMPLRVRCFPNVMNLKA